MLPENFELLKQVKFIVNMNSGGIKFTELLPKLKANMNSFDSDELLDLIKEDSELKVLTYTYKTLNREKYFIFTP